MNPSNQSIVIGAQGDNQQPLYGIAFIQSIAWSLNRPRDIAPGDIWINFPAVDETGLLSERPINLGREVWLELNLRADVDQISNDPQGNLVIYFQPKQIIGLDSTAVVPVGYDFYVVPYKVETIGTTLNQTAVLTIPPSSVVGSSALNYVNPQVINNPKTPQGYGNIIAPTPNIVNQPGGNLASVQSRPVSTVPRMNPPAQIVNTHQYYLNPASMR